MSAFHFVGGHWVKPTKPQGEIVVQSPSNLDDEVARFTTDLSLVDDAVLEARHVSARWRRMSFADRCTLLRTYQNALTTRKEDLALAIAREIGKPLWEARSEVAAMIAKVDLALDEGIRFTLDERLDNLPGEIRYRPHGVMAIIGPFNFPGHLPNGQFIPALAVGNTVIFKPSDKAPLTSRIITECITSAGFPRGVFQLVQGGADVAQKLVAHPGIDGIFFTGSSTVGQSIVQANIHRPGCLIALELGGKNAALVFDDANMDRAVREISFAAFATAGQRCTATSRVYVHRARADELISRLTKITANVRVGHYSDENAFCGPMINEASITKLEAAHAIAKAAGFSRAAGGGRATVDGFKGHYVRPSIHVAPKGDAVAPGYSDQELFGPDVAVYPVDDHSEAVARANDSAYGLVASVFTQSESRFEHAADMLRVGVLHWNRSTAGASGRLPFGGLGSSGNHRPASIMAGAQCTYAQGVYLSPPDDTPLSSWPGLPSDTP